MNHDFHNYILSAVEDVVLENVFILTLFCGVEVWFISGKQFWDASLSKCFFLFFFSGLCMNEIRYKKLYLLDIKKEKAIFHLSYTKITLLLSISICWPNQVNQMARKKVVYFRAFTLPTPNSCLCFELFHPLRTPRCFSGPLLFLVKGSFIWEKSPISDQRFALMQIFINLQGHCGLYSSLPFWWELNLIPYCGLYGS